MHIRFADFLISHSRITWSFRRLPSAQLMNIRHLEYTDFFFLPQNLCNTDGGAIYARSDPN